ncbi:hypothetical protein HDZ31DRAFT_65709 [Schizophyllum fasciatum]
MHDKLEATSKNSMLSLMRTNRKIHNIVLPFTVHRFVLDVSEQVFAQTNARIEAWIESGDLVKKYTRHLTLRAPCLVVDPEHGAYGRMHWVRWKAITQLLRVLKQLKSLIFDCPTTPPYILLATLERHHPTAHLHVRDFTRNRHLSGHDQSEMALAESTLLRSFHAYHSVSQARYPDLRWAVFLRIVRGAPNLQSVSFEALKEEPLVGLIPTTPHGKAAYDALLAGTWHGKRNIRSIHVDGAEALAGVLECVNMECIEELGLLRIGADWEGMCGATLRALRELRLLFEPMHAADSVTRALVGERVSTFFSELPPLESLSILGPRDVLPDLSAVLARHGPSLRRLHIHQREVYPEPGVPPRRVLSIGELTSIRDDCPHLIDISIDIDPTGHSHIGAVCDLLGRPPRLHRATINFDIGLHLVDAMMRHASRASDQPESWPADLVDLDARFQRYRAFNNAHASAMWYAIAAEGTRHAELVIREGEPDSPVWATRVAGDIMLFPAVEAKLSRQYRVTPSERDNQRIEVAVDQTAVSVSAMRRLCDADPVL